MDILVFTTANLNQRGTSHVKFLRKLRAVKTTSKGRELPEVAFLGTRRKNQNRNQHESCMVASARTGCLPGLRARSLAVRLDHGSPLEEPKRELWLLNKTGWRSICGTTGADRDFALPTHLPPTSAATTKSLALPAFPAISGHVSSLRMRTSTNDSACRVTSGTPITALS